VEVVDLKAQEIPDALTRGDIDAASTFNPYVAFTQKKLGDRMVAFRDKDLYTYHFNVVSTQEFIRKNPDKVRKVLAALVRAEEFVRGNPAEAQKIVSDFSGIEPGIVRDIWADASFTVTLDQSLILALEDESRWAINGGLIGAREVPNYLDFVYIEGLKTVKPEAVSILR
jgi:NitT/TauT family transport system substrate-binding protein